MREGIVCAGFGGQGVMIMGRLLSGAAMTRGFEVTWMPSYGAEVRGGTAHSMVMISDELIPSPIVSVPDVGLILNQPSLDKFEKRLKKNGLLVVNTTLASGQVSRKDLKVLGIPATEMASEMGSIQVANMIVLGAYVAYRNILPLETVIEELSHIIPPYRHHLLPVNEKALRYGAGQVKNK